MALWKWSQTGSANAASDPPINWNEGQAPSTVNDSARAMMASVAMYRDDIAGAIVTAGSNVAYTVATFSGFDSLAHLDKQMVCFTPHASNGGAATLSTDATGARPLRTAPGAELLPGTIVLGTPYVAVYNHTDGVYYLQGVYGNPYNIPLAAGMDFWAPTAPNSSFAFLFGQAISRVTYSGLFGLIGTSYGAGDGTLTFNLPDKRGRISAGSDTMGGAGAGRLTGAGGMNGTGIGAVGGAETRTLSLSQIPSGITSAGSSTVSVLSSQSGIAYGMNTGSSTSNNGGNVYSPGTTSGSPVTLGQIASTGGGSASVTSNNTGGAAVQAVQPSIVCNYIMRIL